MIYIHYHWYYFSKANIMNDLTFNVENNIKIVREPINIKNAIQKRVKFLEETLWSLVMR